MKSMEGTNVKFLVLIFLLAILCPLGEEGLCEEVTLKGARVIGIGWVCVALSPKPR